MNKNNSKNKNKEDKNKIINLFAENEELAIECEKCKNQTFYLIVKSLGGKQNSILSFKCSSCGEKTAVNIPFKIS